MFVSAPSRRHVVYLWHHWRRDHCHHGRSNRGSDSAQPDEVDGPNLQTAEAQSRVNGERHTGEAMEVDGGASLPDPRDSKRLKRGVLPTEPPALSSEHSFVSSVLDSCRNPEQRRFALEYRKWIDSVIGQQP